MNFGQFHAHCSALPGAEETFPFDESVLVFKVGGKMFALTNVDTLPFRISLKCDPDRAIDLREEYEAVQPGYHLNKAHWNTVELDGTIPDHEVREWIDHSYGLVLAGLTKKARAAIQS